MPENKSNKPDKYGDSNRPHLAGLNPAQREAALALYGPLMIVAGAGAGKTKTITHRMAHMVSEGIPADAILAVTFTNKAAGEMRDRVAKLLDMTPEANFPLSQRAKGGGPFISTFHSLGVYLLRRHSESAGIPRNFSIWDRADSLRSVKAALAMKEMEKLYEPRRVLGRISRTKGEGISAADFARQARGPWEETVADIWRAYENDLQKSGALDFDDLLVRALRLLSDNAGVLEQCHTRWQHVTIDEYQDTNRVQLELVRLLARPRNNICVVGDIDQSIYSWRGANMENLMSFENMFPGAKTVLLEQNYRSTQNILAAANGIISHNSKRVEKTLFTKNEGGEKIAVYHAIGEADEAAFIAEKAASLMAGGTSAGEIAVLYRANFQSRVLEEAFLYAGVPYRVLGTRFFERKEVKDVLSYLRAALNPQSRVDLARIIAVPPRGIGKQTLIHMLEGTEGGLGRAAGEKVRSFRALLRRILETANAKTLPDTLKTIVAESGLEAHLMKRGEEGQEQLENIRELITLSMRYANMPPLEAAEKLIEDAALASEQDSLNSPEKDYTDGGRVSLMTAHASKGLEFGAVFVAGLEEGLFPHEAAGWRSDEAQDEEEERRLFYVSVTRARKRLFLTHAAVRMMYGVREIRIPSSFLSHINPELLEHIEPSEIPASDREPTIR